MKNKACNSCPVSLACPLAFLTNGQAEEFVAEWFRANPGRYCVCMEGRGGAYFLYSICRICERGWLLVIQRAPVEDKKYILETECNMMRVPRTEGICATCYRECYGKNKTTKGSS